MQQPVLKASDWPIFMVIGGVVATLLIVVGPGFDAFWASMPAFAKSAVGPFIGAGLAFLFSTLHRRHDQTTKDIRAGNLALFLVWSFLSDCYYMRAVLRAEANPRVSKFPDTPDWALLRPNMHSYVDDHAFDLDSLAFLLDSADGRSALVNLKFSESLFTNMKHVHSITMETLQELQKATVEIYKSKRNAGWKEMEDHIGVELARRAGDQTRALFVRTERDFDHHRRTFDMLAKELRERFSSNVWDLSPEPKERFELARLPPLPPEIQKHIDSLPG